MFYLMMKVNVSKDVHKSLERKALRPLLCDILYLFGQGNSYYQGKNGMMKTDVCGNHVCTGSLSTPAPKMFPRIHVFFKLILKYIKDQPLPKSQKRGVTVLVFEIRRVEEHERFKLFRIKVAFQCRT